MSVGAPLTNSAPLEGGGPTPPPPTHTPWTPLKRALGATVRAPCETWRRCTSAHSARAQEAVLREVQEESGVVVDLNTLQYHSTQPWLFPRSLMVGFLVQPHPLSPPVTVDMDELEDVRWFDKASVRNCLQGLPRVPGSDLPQGFHLPTPATLAHALISSWALEK